MRALSIRQPWAHAILHFGKRVENRGWTWAPLWRDTFLIHAAKGCTREEYLDAADFMRGVYAAHPWSGSTILPCLSKVDRGAIVGRAKLIGAHRRAPSPWAIPDELHLVMADVERLVEPIPFKGALGFFEVDEAFLEGAKWEPCS